MKHDPNLMRVNEVLYALARIRDSLKWVEGNCGVLTASDLETLSAAIEEWHRLRQQPKD